MVALCVVKWSRSRILSDVCFYSPPIMNNDLYELLVIYYHCLLSNYYVDNESKKSRPVKPAVAKDTYSRWSENVIRAKTY